MKKISILFLCILSFILVACNNSTGSAENQYGKSEEVTNFVQLTMEDGKEIVLELYPEHAPITVKNFQDLVADGFYNGLTIHRIVEDFVIQGGDPRGDGTGGPGHYIVGEFKNNGHDNPIRHKQGTLSMARSQDPNSAGSQFFICLSDDTAGYLDNEYAAFGEVVYGMDNVLKIEEEFLSGKTLVPVIQEAFFVKK